MLVPNPTVQPPRRLASIGSRGRLPNHMHRDVMRKSCGVRLRVRMGFFAYTECLEVKFCFRMLDCRSARFTCGSPLQCKITAGLPKCMHACMHGDSRKFACKFNGISKMHVAWLRRRILKPTEFTAIAGSVRVFLLRRTLANGLETWVRVNSSVLWPHEMWAGLWSFHPGAFLKFILGGRVENVEDFWRTMPRREGMDTAGWEKQAVPIALHGDGVAVANVRGVSSKCADTWSWTSLLSTGHTKLTHYFIWFTFSHLAKKSGFATTWKSFWWKLSESLRCLRTGKWPDRTMQGLPEARAGQDLAGGFWGVLYVVRGDLEWMSKHFGMPTSTSAQPCALCGAGNTGAAGEVPWTDVNYPPRWAELCWTDEVPSERKILFEGVGRKGRWLGIEFPNGCANGCGNCLLQGGRANTEKF